jgi:hypothetical protein
MDMGKLMGDQDHIRENLFAYVQAFSPAARDIFALRYAWRERRTWRDLRTFLRENGGPAGCADQFAAINPRGRYRGRIVYRRPGTGRPYLIVHKAI